MSCNGCRVLRKGCSDDCMLRHCLQSIDNPQAQAHATVFLAKFFGRAGLMSFISSVPINQRLALFQSLLYEAVGRTVNPVTGAVGLLWTGNWHICQLGVEIVLRGGALNLLPEEYLSSASSVLPVQDYDHDHEGFESVVDCCSQPLRDRDMKGDVENFQPLDLDLCLKTGRRSVVICGGREYKVYDHQELRSGETPSQGSEMTTLGSSRTAYSDSCPRRRSGKGKLMRLFI
ncbi:putative LOB domain-containing protein [Quillaja saponaria]|uniref:LOB domain-containing protein n=1 Tax=Quillaja saponaria TaxID=32244 RepID=A0AAD7M0L3_QUISA|nr:putative LOB domain-containing protein [Quillaja saponaria]